MSVLHRVLTARTSEPLTLTGREVNQLQREIRELHAPAGLTARESLQSLCATMSDSVDQITVTIALLDLRDLVKAAYLGEVACTHRWHRAVEHMLNQPEFAKRKLPE